MQPLWTPQKAFRAQTRIAAFQDFVRQHHGTSAMETMDEVHAWALKDPGAFWGAFWHFAGVRGDAGQTAFVPGSHPLEARFFPEAQLNFAENLLKGGTPDREAIVFRTEAHPVTRRVTFAELERDVAALARFFLARGVRPGDRIAAVMPNIPETVIAMLAATAVGAVWSVCSPDFGLSGLVDRLGQIEPVVLLCCDQYPYQGKIFSQAEKNAALCQHLPSVHTFVACGFEPGDSRPVFPDDTHAVPLKQIFAEDSGGDFIFPRFPFDHPLVILFSSGTTGVPKCIVHRAGGVLLETLKEHQLHSDIRPLDRVFYYTTCGWMMWNWQVGALASGATLLLYEGSPLFPDEAVLWRYAAEERMTFFGGGARYFDALRKVDFCPPEPLPHLRTLASTGSPLAHETFRYIYARIKADLHLTSVSGGTDILGCFLLGNPLGPVWPGELQTPSLGLHVDVDDGSGHPTRDKGELVCRNAFPSMPLAFWNDPDKKRYRKTYFESVPGIWCHGDYAQWTEHGGMVIFGRSDATLNPGGVRIGTAEIYRQVEKIPDVLESIVVGQDVGSDVRVVLFVRLEEHRVLDESLVQHIRQHIRRETTPRHVPALVVQVKRIPRTKNAKLVEMAVRQVIHGQPVSNVGALADPDVLEDYRDLPQLKLPPTQG